MKVEQIAIFLENKSGRLSEIAGVLADNGVNIRSLSLADTADFGILRLIVDKVEEAEAVLRKGGFTVGRTHVIAVEVPDKPGGLHNILMLLHNSDINVEYMYAFVQQSGNNAVMIFRFDNTDDAIKLLEKNGITIINGSKVYTL